MLKITVPGVEFFDDAKQEFTTTNDVVLELEHSLVSLSKWESFWEKPFLGAKDRTDEETYWYVKAMTLTPDVPPEVYSRLSSENIKAIDAHITANMTATWFANTPSKGGAKEVITAEIIYYWMIALGIPLECERWHLNRLLTLIKVCNQKNAPQKKMTPREIAERNRDLNAQRKAKHQTNG